MLEHLQFNGDWTISFIMISMQSNALFHKEQNYIWFRSKNFNFLMILGHFLFKGVRTTVYHDDLHTIRCYLTQETRIFMVKGRDLNSFRDIRTLPI
jgi:hypothetical protein